MGIKNRLDLVIRELGVSGRELARQCGFSESYYSTINDGISVSKLNIILSEYPQMSAEWLLTGKGEMLKKSEVNNTSTAEISEKYIKILETYAETIKSQQQTIASLLSKGAAVDAPGAAPMAAKG